jgi:hypothetical protein
MGAAANAKFTAAACFFIDEHKTVIAFPYGIAGTHSGAGRIVALEAGHRNKIHV